MIRYNDIPNMTIRELGKLAEEAAAAKPGTRWTRQLADRMCAASLYLEDSGALARLLWWAPDLRPDAPPDARAKLLEFRTPKERTPPFLVL